MAVFLTVRGHEPGLYERLDKRQYPLILDPCPAPVHQGDMPDFIETCLDVRFQCPFVPGGGEVMDLGDRVVLTPAGAEPVRERLEIRLEDGLEHQLQGGLDDPVLHGRYP